MLGCTKTEQVLKLIIDEGGDGLEDVKKVECC